MPHSLRTLLAAVCCAGILVFALARRPPSRAAAEARVLESTDGFQWYRGNIHTHSLWSDGDDYLESIALWYREHGYDFVCFTDHNVLPRGERWIDALARDDWRRAYDKLKTRFPDSWIDERTRNGRLEVRLKTFDEIAERFNEPGRFLVIQGEEITDRFRNLPVHLNVTNVAELVPPMHGESVFETMRNNVDRVRVQQERTGQPMLVHLNHPNFHYAITSDDLARLAGENFFEVYNGHPAVHNSGDRDHPSTDRMWDLMLTRRLGEFGLEPIYGLAVDDGHDYHRISPKDANPGRGWIMVLARELTPASLIEAMHQGRFYASSGVTLKRIVSSATGCEVEVAPQAGVSYVIEFIGTRKNALAADSKSDPNGGNSAGEGAAIGEVLKRVEAPQGQYEFQGDELYVRARITSSRRHPNPSEPGEFERAWCQPVVGPAAKSN